MVLELQNKFQQEKNTCKIHNHKNLLPLRPSKREKLGRSDDAKQRKKGDGVICCATSLSLTEKSERYGLLFYLKK